MISLFVVLTIPREVIDLTSEPEKEDIVDLTIDQ